MIHIRTPILTNILAVGLQLSLGILSPAIFAQDSSAATVSPSGSATADQREQFMQAWQAARRGDRARAGLLASALQDYVLYPYLRYDEYLARRTVVDPDELARFLNAHTDWAFHKGLRRSWLRSLGETGRWDALLKYTDASDTDTEIQCHLAQARIQKQQQDGLLEQAQALWAVGKSQPDACDPVFSWLKKQNGITPELAWLRVSRAIQTRNSRMTLYLSRYLSGDDKVWLERWQQQDSSGYLRLDRSRSWPDHPRGHEIVSFGLQQLARKDSARAWQLFPELNKHFSWNETTEGAILREIALWSAVSGDSDATLKMRGVPKGSRDDQLLEWWARSGLATQNWAEVILAVAEMSPDMKASERWQYWDARARIKLGDEDYAQTLLEQLAGQASYHGFLAADLLNFPYAICPLQADFGADAVDAFANRPTILRSQELQRVDLKSWSRSEWSLATKAMSAEDLRLAAAFATDQGWYYEAIVALAGSGELQWYDWRFPMAYANLVLPQASKRQLDSSWVMGLMRSESAMAADAISSADARGLMQVLPSTAKQIARRNAYSYSGSEQLMQAETNILFGTTFLRELMDKFNNNPVLVSGAYNAGPGAVERWLQTLPGHDASIWIEVLPYYETRDYIPRVMAFATIYNFLLSQQNINQPLADQNEQPRRLVQRISTRMPPPDASLPRPAISESAAIACPVPIAAEAGER